MGITYLYQDNWELTSLFFSFADNFCKSFSHGGLICFYPLYKKSWSYSMYQFKIFTGSGMKGLEWTSSHQCTSSGWARWSRFADEQKSHPPCPHGFFFPTSSLPQNFPPSTYHLPTPPPLTPLPELQRHQAGANLELEPDLLEQELGAGAWSRGAVAGAKAGPTRDPGKHFYFFFSFVCFVYFVCSSLLCSCGATAQRSKEGNTALQCCRHLLLFFFATKETKRRRRR